MIKKYFLTAAFLLCLVPLFAQPCAAPVALNITNVTGTSAVLSWSSVNNETQWEVLLLLESSPEPTVSNNGTFATTNPYVITGLTPCTQYKVYVRSLCSPTEISSWTQGVHFSTGGSCAFAVQISATQDIPTSSLFAQVIGGTPPFTYQWSYNGAIIAGATSSGIAVNGQFGLYEVTVTDAASQVVTASYQVSGMAIFALPDTLSIYPTNTITTTITSVMANDFLMGSPIYPSTVSSVIMTPLSVPSGFLINPNGTVSVLPGTAPGTYTLTYQICAVQSPASCAVGTATVTIANEGFLLNAFVDTNTNGIQDLGETSFNYGQFHYQLNNAGPITTVASSDGTYYLQESNTANTYDLSYTIDSNHSSYYTVLPAAYNNISYVAGSGVIVYNFPVTQLPYTDLSVAILPYGAPPRPGFTYRNQISYKNNGNLPIAAGTITFTKDNALTITNISQAGTTPTGTGFTYDFVNLLPNEVRNIYVTMQVPTIPTVNLGNMLTNTATTPIPVGDINVSNNASSLAQVIVGSYDPNDKTENHGDRIVHAAFGATDYLTYTIQFENTGTYPAENVRINDILNNQLDETTVKMIDASHSYTLNQVGATLNWNLNGIDLVPSGKGYVTFQIKPKPGYAIGDIIPNTASIYFDFNPAIVTNTFTTEFVSTMGVSDFNSSSFSVYPNPTNGMVYIVSNDNLQIDNIIINDISGKTIQMKTINGTRAAIDLTNLASGMYFVKATSEGSEKTIKVIRQ